MPVVIVLGAIVEALGGDTQGTWQVQSCEMGVGSKQKSILLVGISITGESRAAVSQEWSLPGHRVGF